jgi:hypothetical protein
MACGAAMVGACLGFALHTITRNRASIARDSATSLA